MGLIVLEGMKFHAYHGLHPEERVCGGEFVVDVYIDYPFEGGTDKIAQTANYELIYIAVKKRMQQPVNLIEFLAESILDDLKSIYPEAGFRVRLSKMHPAIGGPIVRTYTEVQT
ncbi:MAG: dihydroneopterin aldolase [Bacteroidia bacterium]